jgi:threonine dehydratase
VAEVVAAAEGELEDAIRFMVTGAGLVVEGAAAAGVAAVRAGRVVADGPVVIVISGRNIARQRLAALLAEG